jgi:hypothetical protein
MHALPLSALAAAFFWLAFAAAAWQWQRTTLDRLERPAVQEPWEHVRERFPMEESIKPASTVSEAWLQVVTHANPFSSKRREVATPTQPDALQLSTSAPPPPPPALFLYKGRVQMGSKQRAVLEDAAGKKTYFAEVGQTVAGHEVLEIDDERVVLLSQQTGETLTVALMINEGPKTEKGKRTSPSSTELH